MTEIRKSLVFRMEPEGGFGKFIEYEPTETDTLYSDRECKTTLNKAPEFTVDSNNSATRTYYVKTDCIYSNKWWCIPIANHFSFTPSRQAESLYGTGDKFREAVSYGYFTGSWNLSFTLDYEHLEPFTMIFEDYSDPVVATVDVTAQDGSTTKKDKIVKVDGNEVKLYKITLGKKNSARVRSFQFRVKQLNHIAGGDEYDDEIITLTGCVAKQISVSRSAQSGQATVEMNGVFVDYKTEVGKLTQTDYTDYSSTHITEYSCMFLGDISEGNYVADVDAHSFAVENSIGQVYSTCKGTASNYWEGRVGFQWNAQTYSNGPSKKFRFLPNSGGYDRTHTQPMCKGLKPTPTVTFTTFNGMVCGNDTGSTTADQSIKGAHDNSVRSMDFVFKDSVIKSITYPKGEGGKMSDSLSSVDCGNMSMTVTRSDSSSIWDSKKSRASIGVVLETNETTSDESGNDEGDVTGILKKKTHISTTVDVDKSTVSYFYEINETGTKKSTSA